MFGRRSRWTTLLLVAAASAAVPPSEARDASGQVVRSEDGLLASGYVAEAPFPDGTTRRLEVMLVVPTGATSSTGFSGHVDVARPWALFSQTIVSDPPSGHRTAGTVLCDEVANPVRLDTGAVERRGTSRVWAGTLVEVRCEGDSGFDVYRVRWDPPPHWPLVTNRATAAWMGGQLSRWSSTEAEGLVQLSPSANQQMLVTVCGTRHLNDEESSSRPGRATCFDGMGQVIPSSAGMVAQVNDRV